MFSDKLWGLKKGDLIVVGARPSNGKSALTAQIAYDLAHQGNTVLIISLEMSVEAILERLFCLVSDVPSSVIERGGFATDRALQAKFDTFKAKIDKLDLIITCGIGATYPELIEMVETIKPDMVVLDYIQAIKNTGGQTLEIINEYLRQFTELVRTYKIIGILCSQINRGGAMTRGQEPTLSQLKSSGSLEEFADLVILCHYPSHYDHEADPNEYKLLIEKNRNGRTGVHYLSFFAEKMRFKEPEKVIPPPVAKVFKNASVVRTTYGE